MKTRQRLIVAFLPTLLLAACATMDDRYVAAESHARMVNDADYIAAVETVAANRGVRVLWVHPPKVERSED